MGDGEICFTGVEIAGQIGELVRDTVPRYFKHLDRAEVKILLVEMADRLLAAFPESLASRAADDLRGLGVTPLLTRTVIDIDRDHLGGAELACHAPLGRLRRCVLHECVHRVIDARDRVDEFRFGAIGRAIVEAGDVRQHLVGVAVLFLVRLVR